MKGTLLFLFLSLFLWASSQENKIKYNISVSLNDSDHSLDGFMQVDFKNNSADTIRYLWFNVYPNAFKSDRTAFSEYLLGKDRTDFYFSDKEKRGYINRLDFRSKDNILRQEDHPLYIDVIKVLLNKPLAPGETVLIATPFHVKLPYNFDGIGYKYPQYNLKYWYPAVAAFIKPLTTPDSSSNEIADYDITLTLPGRFSVQSPSPEVAVISDKDSLKTVRYRADNLHDFSFIITKPHNLSEPAKQRIDQALSQKIKKLVSHQLLPAVGYNEYDGFQLGILAHNSSRDEPLNYYAAPLYTFRSKTIAGIAGASYRLAPNKYADEIELGFSASSFSYNDGADTSAGKVFARLFKVVPYVRMKLPSRSSRIDKSLSFRTYIISEKDLDFVQYSVDSLYYPAEGKYQTRYINQLNFDYSFHRALYPYHTQLQLQQGKNFYRFNASGEYFFNYAKGGGVNVRVFAAKFGYLGSVSASEKFETTRYQPKLTAVRGDEDFTYSNYFIGRNSFDGLPGRQIMMRDGGLKLRTDLFADLQGRSDNWIAALNLNTSIPEILPVGIPLKIFFDAGTYAEAWDEESTDPRFFYVAGLQLSLFRNLVNIYAPLMYSKTFRDRLNSVPEQNTFFKKISFSIDFSEVLAWLKK